MNKQTLGVVGLVALAVISRIVCAQMGWYNFAPIVAIGLLSGMLIKDAKTAFIIALSGQFLADIFFQIFPTAINYGFYGLSQLFVYGGLLMATLIGLSLKKVNAKTVLGGTIGASLAFFIISNLGYFAQGFNGYSISGFVKTYVDALPFFRNSLQADLLGSAVLFSLYFVAKNSFATKLKTA